MKRGELQAALEGYDQLKAENDRLKTENAHLREMVYRYQEDMEPRLAAVEAALQGSCSKQ